MGNLTTNKRIVAIIDDDPSVLRGLKRLLEASDFTTQVFSSAEAFLDCANASDVMCIVLDIHLGGISGIEMRRRLTAMGSTVPVIFITALDSTAVQREAVDAGCAAYLPKPFFGHVLIDSIRKATSLV
jgi:FixJ family two-component response regulator